MTEHETLAARIDALLERLDVDIRAGVLSGLDAQASELDGLLTELAASDMSRRDILKLRARANRTAETLVAAGQGVRAAHRRVVEIVKAARGVATYDRLGQRSILAGSERSTPRRY